jgi:hypothetical protein
MKEPADKMGATLKAAQNPMRTGLQLRFCPGGPPAQLGFDMSPCQFVGVQVWRVRWQEVHLQASCLPCGKRLNPSRLMHRMAIEDQHNLAGHHLHQMES